jgi:hypothetical protein
MAMLDVLEQAGGVEDLKSRFQAEQKPSCGGGDFDRAERHALDSCRDLAQLIGWIHFNFDPAVRAGFDA